MIKYPAIKFTLAFAGGIILHNFYSLSFLFLAAASVVSFIFIIIKILQKKPDSLPAQALLYLIIIMAGNFNSGMISHKNNLLPESLIKEDGCTAYGIIDELNLIRDGRITLLVKADSIRVGNSLFKGRIGLISEVRTDSRRVLDSLYESLVPGMRIKQTGAYQRGRWTRNPGEFDYDNYLRNKGISGIIRSSSPADIELQAIQSRNFESFIFKVRKGIDEKITEFHSKETSALIRGLLLGDRSNISYQVKDEFINSGVMHILAVSGLHTVYIAMIFLILFGRFSLVFRSLLTVTGLIVFLLITGFQVSVFRAVIMSALVITSLLTNRSTNIYNSLSIAALILLIIDPGELYDPGFLLSFSAVLSIAALYPVLRDLLPPGLDKFPLVRTFILFVFVSLAAQIGTLPITIFYFDKLSLISLFANIIVIPLGGIIIANAIFTLSLSFVVPAATLVYAAAGELFTRFMYSSVNFASEAPLSFLFIHGFSLSDVIIAYFFIMAFFIIIRKVSFRGSVIIIILTIINLILYTSLDNKELLGRDKLSLLMIDVGQGDAFLISTPEGKTILIDAGQADKYSDRGEQVIIPLLNYLGINKVDYAFITHLDLDHYGGIISLVQKNKIKHLMIPPSDFSDPDKKLNDYLRNIGQSYSCYSNNIMKIDSMRFYILDDFRYSSGLKGNDASGVFRIVYGNTSFLFTGDIQKTAENLYINRYGRFLESDVLKISHHGSRSSTSEKFVKLIKPDFALISAGYKNRFKHPSEEVTNTLQMSGVKILRSDLNGAILLQSDGKKVKQINWNI